MQSPCRPVLGRIRVNCSTAGSYDSTMQTDTLPWKSLLPDTCITDSRNTASRVFRTYAPFVYDERCTGICGGLGKVAGGRR